VEAVSVFLKTELLWVCECGSGRAANSEAEAGRVADGEAGRAAAHKRARQKPGRTNSASESDVQDSAVPVPSTSTRSQDRGDRRQEGLERERGGGGGGGLEKKHRPHFLVPPSADLPCLLGIYRRRLFTF
jgi:hypothetical protein